jgi:hypothetical protein
MDIPTPLNSTLYRPLFIYLEEIINHITDIMIIMKM